MSLEGPQPQTDREYLIRIYDTVNAVQGQLAEERLDVAMLGLRVSKLEAWRERIVGATWLAAKGFGMLVAGITLATVVIKLAEALGIGK